ncbi:MAG TPA: phosphate ABC transporter permease PstA [Pseudonocardiaceae bacterium]|jgi:phosphate transport system permease protein|nr:phosphate ABC transporter permease PstA [Pseudonocardiaceae bacterium]
MSVTTSSLDTPIGGPSLARPRLRAWAFWVTAVAVYVVLRLLFLFTVQSGQPMFPAGDRGFGQAVDAVLPAQAAVQFLLIFVVGYVLVQTIVSATVEGWRHAKDRFMTSLLTVAMVIAVLPLVSVLVYTVTQGVVKLDGYFLSHSMRAVAETDPNGGAYQAIIGTLEQVGLATVISVPFGIMVAVYLVEYSSGRLGRVVSFFVDVMTGLPSIVAGLFVLALWVLLLGQGVSGFAGSLALVILMLPTVVRSTEEMLKLVPVTLREASFALGVPKWLTVVRIVLPTAVPGIITGVMLAVSRVMGETAPVLLTVLGNPAINFNPFSGPQASLPLYVFSEVGQSSDNAVARAWSAALTLIIIVLVLNLIARAVARFTRVNG